MGGGVFDGDLGYWGLLVGVMVVMMAMMVMGLMGVIGVMVMMAMMMGLICLSESVLFLVGEREGCRFT